MMTKKDYIRAAEICKDDFDSDEHVVKAFVDFFTGDNPRFDVERFVAACMPEEQRPARRR